jgi:hypothetical protein
MNRGERVVIYTFAAALGVALGYWLVHLGWAL